MGSLNYQHFLMLILHSGFSATLVAIATGMHGLRRWLAFTFTSARTAIASSSSEEEA